MPNEPIYSFTNTIALVVGIINLRIAFGERKGRSNRMAEFIVVEINSVFKAIIGRPDLHAFKEVLTTYH